MASEVRVFAWVLLVALVAALGWIVWQAMIAEANASLPIVHDEPPSGDTNG